MPFQNKVASGSTFVTRSAETETVVASLWSQPLDGGSIFKAFGTVILRYSRLRTHTGVGVVGSPGMKVLLEKQVFGKVNEVARSRVLLFLPSVEKKNH